MFVEEKFDFKELEIVVNGCWFVVLYIGDCVFIMFYEDFLKVFLYFV